MLYALIILALFTSSCSKKSLEAPLNTYPVKVTHVEKKSTDLYIESLGHVESIVSIQIRSRVEGQIVGVHFSQGGEVRKNDLLFSIDSRPYVAALEEANAKWRKAKAEYELAQEKLKRYKILAQEEFYSQMDYETLQSEAESCKAVLQEMQANVENAKIRLDYCSIYAPIDGKTGLLHVDFGNLVSNFGDPITTLNQMAPIYVTFSIPEFELPRLRHAGSALKVLASFEDFDGECFEGKLAIIDNQVNEKTGMMAMRAIFDNDQRDLWPGQFIKTRLIVKTLDAALMIPYSAVQLTQSGPIVYVLNTDGTVDPKEVKLGQREGLNVLILNGLTENQTIVSEGQINLYKGAKVRVVNESL